MVLALTLLDVSRPASELGPDTRLLPPSPAELAKLPGEWRLVVYLTETESGRRVSMSYEGGVALLDLNGSLDLDLAVTSATRSDGFDISAFAGHDVGQDIRLRGYYHHGVISFSYPGFDFLFDAAAGDDGVFRDSRSLRENNRDILMECELTPLAWEGGE